MPGGGGGGGTFIVGMSGLWPRTVGRGWLRLAAAVIGSTAARAGCGRPMLMGAVVGAVGVRAVRQMGSSAQAWADSAKAKPTPPSSFARILITLRSNFLLP